MSHDGPPPQAQDRYVECQLLGVLHGFDRAVRGSAWWPFRRNVSAMESVVRVAVDAAKIASLRTAGASWQAITRELGISAGTAKRAFYSLSKNPSNPASVSA